MFKKGDVLEVIKPPYDDSDLKNGDVVVAIGDEIERERHRFIAVAKDGEWIRSHHPDGWLVTRFKLYEGKKKAKNPRPPAVYPGLYAKAKLYQIKHRGHMNIAQLKAAIAAYEANPIPLEVVLREKVGTTPDVSCFAMEYDNGARRFHPRAICHAGLQYADFNCKHITKLVEDVAGHYYVHKNKELYKEFIHYILNDSPWSSSFITKDVNKALLSGILTDIEKPFSHVACSLIALRQGSEYSNKLDAWKFAMDKGLSRNEAWFAAQGFNVHANKFEAARINGDHDVFQNGMRLKEVVDFFKKGFHKYTDQPVKDSVNKRYSIFSTISNAYIDEGSLLRFFDKNILSEKIARGWNFTVVIKEEGIVHMLEKVKELFK